MTALYPSRADVFETHATIVETYDNRVGCLLELILQLMLVDPFLTIFVVLPVRAIFRPFSCPRPLRLGVAVSWFAMVGCGIGTAMAVPSNAVVAGVFAAMTFILMLLTALVNEPARRWTLDPFWG